MFLHDTQKYKMGNLKSQKSNVISSLQSNHSTPKSPCFGFELGGSTVISEKKMSECRDSSFLENIHIYLLFFDS